MEEEIQGLNPGPLASVNTRSDLYCNSTKDQVHYLNESEEEAREVEEEEDHHQHGHHLEKNHNYYHMEQNQYCHHLNMYRASIVTIKKRPVITKNRTNIV